MKQNIYKCNKKKTVFFLLKVFYFFCTELFFFKQNELNIKFFKVLTHLKFLKINKELQPIKLKNFKYLKYLLNTLKISSVKIIIRMTRKKLIKLWLKKCI